MKTLILMFIASLASATCPAGTVADSGACRYLNEASAEDNAKWVSDEKPPKHPEPAWQRGEVKAIAAPSALAEDLRSDEEKANADREGKMAAGVLK